MRAAVSLCALQLMFAVSRRLFVCEARYKLTLILYLLNLLYARCQSVRQTLSLLFISMSFVTPLDYSVVNVKMMVDNQPAVMKEAMTLVTVEETHPTIATPDLGFY